MTFTFDDYRKYYPYGASAVFSDNPDVNANIDRHRLNNLKRFLSENPSVIPLEKDICCQRQIRDGGTWKCGLTGIPCPKVDDLPVWHHKHGMRIKGEKNSYFVATHPHKHVVKNSQMAEELLEGLVAHLYSADLSWYYPNSTYLFLIGKSEVLEKVSVECLGQPLLIVEGEMSER
ncbi:MAG: hypothetical protein OXU27_03155 [Candidatus Poribacteria bacterium]|nr:hypothetical protein [Candidatus Poribacteria bacterium]